MSTLTTAPSVPVARAPRRASLRRLVTEQAFVAGGQLAAGVGNLAFALLAARVLAPGAFAELTVFLALFLVVHVPLSALSAGSAVTPSFAAAQRRRAVALGAGAGGLLALLALPLSGPLDVRPELLWVLAAGVPAAGWLALERGRLLGAGQHRLAVASLVAEPVLRLGLGLPLAAASGAVGGAVGVVAGGWLALLVCRPGNPLTRGAAAAPAASGAGLATLAFLLLAILQNQDVVLGNALLGGDEAGRFAVLSTLGGVAAFATTTIPLVLLSRAEEGDGALHAALALAAGLGLVATLLVAVLPTAWVGRAFGPAYAGAGPLVAPYVGAMALLGVGRVLVAERVASGRGRGLVLAIVAIVVTQATATVLLGEDARSIAAVTIVAMGALVAASGTALLRRPSEDGAGTRRVAPSGRAREDLGPTGTARPVRERRPRDGAIRRWLPVLGLSVVALAARLAITRGIWLDEATSIAQAQMTWGELMASLRSTDVHPPLHHVTLWLLAHAFGTDELVMRAPSLAAGTLLVPATYALGAVLWDRRAALLGGALVAASPFAIWYAQEARMYACFMLFAVLATLGLALALRGTARRRGLALWVLAGAALLWTQYFGALVVATHVVVLAVVAVQRRDRSLALLGAAAVLAITVLVAPAVPLAVEQFSSNEASGRGFDQGPSQAGDVADGQPRPGVYVVLTNVVWSLLGYHSNATLGRLTALWPLAMLAALFVLGRRPTWRAHVVVATALAPAVLLFALGMAKPFLFEIRYFVATAPLLLLLVARGVTAWVRRPRAIAVIGTALVAALAVATADELANGANPRRYDFEGALERVADQMRPGDVLVYEPSYLNNVVGYYQPDLRSAPASAGVPPRRWAKRVFVLSSFQDRPVHRRNAAAVTRRLARERELESRFTVPQVKVEVFR